MSKAVKVHIFLPNIFKEHFIRFLMLCKMIDFALGVLKLSMFKVFGMFDSLKIKLFNLPSSERVKQK